MADSSASKSVQDVAASFHIADRAAYNYVHMRQWEFFEKALANPWTPECPEGVINLSVAENALMHQDVVDFINKNLAVDPIHHLTYGSGPKGSPRLRKALAAFFNAYFHPREAVQHKDILIMAGVTSVIDNLTWSLCNEGEGIIIPQPFYLGFATDIPARAKGVIVPAEFQSLEGYKGFDDVFDAGMNVRALEAALKAAEEKGTKVRAVLLTNPHNPLGRCYPVDTIKAIASFCGQHQLHHISDEIYANSVFENPKAPGAIPFTSILSLDLDGRIDPQLVHVTYGASKDFCANGLRLGMLHTRNLGLQGAVAGMCMLGWPPYVIQELWAKMLEDEAYTKDFFARNQRGLAEQYARATGFLEQHGIPYYGNSNAGMFIWVDLRKYLAGAGEDVSCLTVRDMIPRAKEEYQRRESEMGSRFFANGVGIAMGSNFLTEELGWFRLTFSVSTEALETGLQRMVGVLREVEKTGWGSM